MRFNTKNVLWVAASLYLHASLIIAAPAPQGEGQAPGIIANPTTDPKKPTGVIPSPVGPTDALPAGEELVESSLLADIGPTGQDAGNLANLLSKAFAKLIGSKAWVEGN